MEKQIKVYLEKGDFSCLQPMYDRDSNILEITAIIRKEWKYGIDIDGNIIFDFDPNGYLNNIDLLIPMKLWKSVDKIPFLNVKENNKSRHSVRISQESLNEKSFNLPLTISLDTNSNKLFIEIGSSYTNNGLTRYCLSERVFIYSTSDGNLKGIEVLLK